MNIYDFTVKDSKGNEVNLSENKEKEDGDELQELTRSSFRIMPAV